MKQTNETRADHARIRMIDRTIRKDEKINPQERKRLLQKRAKRELEAAGYGLKKLQGGGFLLIDGETEETLAEFETIEELGLACGLWGEDATEGDRDPETGRDTPETAAIREKVKTLVPKRAPQSRGASTHNRAGHLHTDEDS